MDKYELVKKLKTLQGLTDDEKAALIGLLRSHKKYGLVWEDKPEAVETELEEKPPTLTEVKERAIVGDTETEYYPNHILIEGDNLHALTALSYTHAGKIDVIYIDPPYNTCNKDFVYNDSFVDTEDAYRHSKWLSFMAKRLRIAKKLLSDKGVIFISIDDNEQANLKLLCDEVFGEINAIGPIIQNKLNAKNDTVNIQKNHEFILCYRKKIRLLSEGSTKVVPNIKIVSKVKKDVFLENKRCFYLNDSITTRGEGGVLSARPNLGYTFYYHPQTKDLQPKYDYDIQNVKTAKDVEDIYHDDKNLIDSGYIAIRPPKVRGHLGCWTWELKKAINEKDNLYVIKGNGRYNVKKRTFVPCEYIVEEEGKYYYERTMEANSKSILEFSTNAGSTLLSEILSSSTKFNNPKNLEMIKYLLNSSTSKSSTILDFFAGSGTTLHATMQLNAEDGGHRQCILVTNNENNICEEVTYERNKRVIDGYTTPKGEQVEGLHQNNLRYYRTDFVGRNRTVKNMRALVEAATDMLCIKENLYQEEPKFGPWRRLPKQVARRFTDGNRQMLVIYKEDNIEEIVDAIYDIELKEKIKIYVFSPDRDPYEDEFADVEDKVELCALPAAIYDAYMRVLPRQKDKRIEIAPETDENSEEAWTLDEEEQA